LLWEKWTGRNNLRVELHRLAEDAGVVLFDAGEDPLDLPDWLSVDGSPEDGVLLDGLDGISAGYDAWLEARRGKADRDGLNNNHASAMARNLASEVRPPFLVVVRARPMGDVDGFTAALGEALHLPVVQGAGGPAKAVHVFSPPYDDDFHDAVLGRERGVSVVRVPAYGEDPLQLLLLRNAYDPSRVRFVELPSLTWPDARSGVLHDRPFDLAAEAYMWSGGSAGFLRELARMGWARDEDGRLALPQRVRAAYQLEIRHASMGARLALERLAVHPGRFTDGLIDKLGARDAVDELERRGWLVYDGAWRFRDPSARLVLSRSLQSGRRASYHRAAAEHFTAEGLWLAATFHQLAAGDAPTVAGPERGDSGLSYYAVLAWLGLDVDGATPETVSVGAGQELALLELGRQGRGLQGEGAEWQVVRWGGQRPSWASFELPDGPQVLHVTGRTWIDPVLGLGVDGDATPLELEVGWGARAVFLAGLREPVVMDGMLLLPLGPTVDVWLLVPPQRELRVLSKADTAVLELEITVHRAGSGVGGGIPGRRVTALDLTGGVMEVGEKVEQWI
ncbi:MAG TPA: hypothetical protein VKA00_00930, partial [Trueperaceae bacterium]|nr:hypothetical protein [Trueperaceae bacterium]